MRINTWPNKLGVTVVVKGRTWDCMNCADGVWRAKLIHNGTYRADRVGSGRTFLEAIGLARVPVDA